ncbi:MAG TPA: outer membrane beta-barrel protein [Bryobacteraceae bacterium]
MTHRIPLVVRYVLLPVALILVGPHGSAQSSSGDNDVEQLKRLVFDLERRVAVLEEQNSQLRASGAGASQTGPVSSSTLSEQGSRSAAALILATKNLRVPGASTALPAQATTAPPASPATPLLPGTLPGGATLNYYFDGYYEYNFNDPTGRVNDLRAYDVLSNVFSINQADFIFDLDPDLTVHRRYGFRVDLQFGQATETLQGNPANETRPEIYRNIFQAYGSYIVPAGRGVDIDFGKWASSLGIEGNYAKDQMNYTRSFYFYFLPFYHSGVRATYGLTDKLTANYWIVNGTNQSEPTNGYKDEMFGYAYQPVKSVNWTFNYYNGQEHADTVPATNCTVPVQPGLCFAPLTPAPNGKIHIFDSYVTWQAAPRLTLAGEGDYVIQREWANATPGDSSSPTHVDGGAGYAQYQLNPRLALATRAEYLSDRGGLFSNETQALKEVTGTYKYSLSDNFDAFLEYRRDWSNRPYFVTSNPANPASHQDTATLGLVWWYGGKQGSW